ncbi:MAG: DUF1003 domain-containing protein [Steroidobacteraceae bacterium]
MHVWHWLLTGLAAGVVARLVISNVRISLGAELALGSLGGLISGSLFRYIGITIPESDLMHIAAALIGAVGTITLMYLVLRATQKAHRLILATNDMADKVPNLSGLGEREQHVIRKFLSRQPIARDANMVDRAHATLGQRAADRIAAFGGSWAFMGLFAAVLIAWMLYNSETSRSFDPYPFILLNLVLSCIAAAQAPVILMSQNRQSEKDRINARLDYEVNLKAEVEILALHEKLDTLRDQEWRTMLLDMQRKQLDLLEKIAQASG